MAQNDRVAFCSAPEDLFVELFVEVFGHDKAQLLVPECGVTDIDGRTRYIDFALETPACKIAFEIDGLAWHHPNAISISLYEDDLLRQNSLVHSGWKVFRWTDRQLAGEPERVKEELSLFLESIADLMDFDRYLPKRRGGMVGLRQHQQEALDALTQLRSEGKTIALLPHATGTGKTHIAVADAKRLGDRTLYIAHTRDLVVQTATRFHQLWPEATTGIFMGDRRERSTHNVMGTVQSVSGHLDSFGAEDFQYLIVDEAHHATAPTYRRVLAYFSPRFIVGLTATPERADGESILAIFQDSAHRLSLQEAVEMGELVPIRCIRVVTNVDLTRVRFNRIQYNRRDIEETVMIPARDQLIVDTYVNHVRRRRAVAFCVNVRHAEDLAELFRKNGVAAQCVSVRMSEEHRERAIRRFVRGRVRVLCACDILNEGWDCPEVEVLLMARPTLSKVVYLQQVGRGTRKAPGKKELLVIDFVDNATRYNAPLSLHRVVGKAKYRPGGLVLASTDQIKQEGEMIANGKTPETILHLGLWARDYQAVDLFNWQEKMQDVLSSSELEMTLAVAEGRIRREVDRGAVRPDYVLPVGDRTYYYFQKNRVEKIRQALGLPKVDRSTIKELFMQFVERMDMSSSYKPVFLLSLLDTVDEEGRGSVVEVVQRFRRFYEQRKETRLPVEKPHLRIARLEELDNEQIQAVMLQMPFRKFEQRHYLRYDRDLAFIRFDGRLWRQLNHEDLAAICRMCEQSVERYYEGV